MDRKLKELKRIIQPEEGLYAVQQIIAAITRRMQETGFDYNKPEEIFTEIQSFTDLAFSGTGKKDRFLSGIEDKLPDVGESLISVNGSGREKYRYAGNPIASYMSDFKAILDD
jgi:hypothetical protein